MRSLKILGLATCLTLALSAPGWAKSKPKPKAGAKAVAAKQHAGRAKGKTAKKTTKKTSKKGAWKRRGQQSIAGERTFQIQEALVNAGYLKSEPSGKMDTATKQALTRLQADNGWQTKVVPDSRALIKLGLGPDHSNLLNPDTAVLPALSSTAAVQNSQPQ